MEPDDVSCGREAVCSDVYGIHIWRHDEPGARHGACEGDIMQHRCRSQAQLEQSMRMAQAHHAPVHSL